MIDSAKPIIFRQSQLMGIASLLGKQELDQLIEALQKARAAMPGVKPVV
jgi:hypothetical protein